ncbi:MAG: glycosyltransferase [Candidatus Rokubacteria bacterium]|nr:glycosyltransferase [Candidatus Rokubacteria bacterium]
MSDGRRPLRVLRLIDRLNVGGPAKHVVWLTAGLDPRRFETTLVAGRVAAGETDMGYFARGESVTPHVMPELSRELGLRDVVVAFKIVRLLFRLAPDVVHTHKAKAGAVGRLGVLFYRWLTPSALWLRPRQCRVVHTYHGHVFHGYYGPFKTALFVAIERCLGRWATDAVLVLSAQQRREIADRYRIAQPAKFRIVPLGLDLEALGGQPGLRTALRLPSDTVVVGVVGRLTEVKNHALLLRAVACLIDDQPSMRRRIHVVVVGDGHLRASLESLARTLGVRDTVTFLGFREDAGALYSDMDVVALSSINEGTPLTLIEGMACGRPVTATEVGGVVDLMGRVREGGDVAGVRVWEHGVTAPSQDAAAFAAALARMVQDPGLRRDMGDRARAFVWRTFSKERLIASIEALYVDLAGDAGPSPAA